MAWTARGFWKSDESDDTASQVASVVSQGGDLMKQARGYGTMLAAKRGMGNSSLAGGTAQGAVLDRAIVDKEAHIGAEARVGHGDETPPNRA